MTSLLEDLNLRLDTLDNSFSPLIFLISNVIEPYQEGILISNNYFDSSYASFNKVI
jgi:hypothetical protein